MWSLFPSWMFKRQEIIKESEPRFESLSDEEQEKKIEYVALKELTIEKKSDDDLLKRILKLYAPVVYLHSQEDFPPLDFAKYLGEAQLKCEVNQTLFQPVFPAPG